MSNFNLPYLSACCCLVTKSCPTLLQLLDCSPPGSSVHGISKARILEWVAISFSRGSFRPGDQTHIFCIGSGFFTTEPRGKPNRGLRVFEKFYKERVFSSEKIMKIIMCLCIMSNIYNGQPLNLDIRNALHVFDSKAPHWLGRKTSPSLPHLMIPWLLFIVSWQCSTRHVSHHLRKSDSRTIFDEQLDFGKEGLGKEKLENWDSFDACNNLHASSSEKWARANFFNFYFIFNWRIITLQYCDSFCHTSTWISHRYTYVSSLPLSPL